MTEIRAFTAGDLGFAAEQTAREGWASGRRDFEVYLEHDPDGCFTAWKDGRPVGMVTTTRYPASGWIGNLIVIPEERSRGLGRALMDMPFRCLSGYRMQLFLYAKAAGNHDLNTANCWAGVDMEF